MWIIMHDFAWNPCMHPSIHLLLCTKTNAPSGLFLTFLAKRMPISMTVWMKMCKTWVFSDMWLLILTPDSSLFSTPPNHRDHNAPCLWHPNWTRDNCQPCICFCTVWDYLPHAFSSPCAVFLENGKGEINESCALITANSLRGTFKGL